MCIVTIVVLAPREKHNVNHMCWHKRGRLHFDHSSELICEPKVEFIKHGGGTNAIASYRMWSLWVTKDKGEGWWSIVGSRGWFVRHVYWCMGVFVCISSVLWRHCAWVHCNLCWGFDPHN
jgi:hypothetical protein